MDVERRCRLLEVERRAVSGAHGTDDSAAAGAQAVTDSFSTQTGLLTYDVVTVSVITRADISCVGSA